MQVRGFYGVLMDRPTIASLLSDASKLLRNEFEFIRTSNPHAGEKGAEAETVLSRFLNQHLPKRWSANSGVIIDHSNNLSRQTDVIVYDAMTSPVYRASERMQIVPWNSVGAVIEVKSKLTKKELKDAYEKIGSCKALKKDPMSSIDSNPTRSDGASSGTLGVVFAFSAELSLNALSRTVKELNSETPSHLWPDLIVILDLGLIAYGVAYPGQANIGGLLLTMPVPDVLTYSPPPWYVHLMTYADGPMTLNRFFMTLMQHLTLYPYRRTSPSYEIALAGAAKEVTAVTGYQFARDYVLRPVPKELIGAKVRPLSILLSVKGGQQIGRVEYIPWQDGAVIRSFGFPLTKYLATLTKAPEALAIRDPEDSNAMLTTILSISEKQFRAWPTKLQTLRINGEILEPE